jgi:hypothetical protein
MCGPSQAQPAQADSGGARLVALRPEKTIDREVRPYVERVRYAGFGSFALLIMVAFLFAAPILRQATSGGSLRRRPSTA